jgi:hypothetical protein
LFPKDDINACFVRVDELNVSLCILFELCLIVRKGVTEKKQDQELMEISCGWSLLPLYTIDGTPLESKSYEMPLFGGTPFEQNVALESILTKPSFFSKKKEPILKIKVWKLKNRVQSQLNNVPSTFIGNVQSIPILSMYRTCLAYSFLDQGHQSDLGSRYDPVLSCIPMFFEQDDIIKFFIQSWQKRQKHIPRGDKVCL